MIGTGRGIGPLGKRPALPQRVNGDDGTIEEKEEPAECKDCPSDQGEESRADAVGETRRVAEDSCSADFTERGSPKPFAFSKAGHRDPPLSWFVNPIVLRGILRAHRLAVG